jgi:hypothetical protein
MFQRLDILVLLLTAGVTLLLSLDSSTPATEKNRLLQQTPRPEPVEAPSLDAIDQAVRRGVDFLLEDQNPNGSWGSATRTKGLNIYAPIPGAHQAFRAGVTSLCLSALIQSEDRRPQVFAAIGRGKAWLLAKLPHVRRANGDAIYNVWAHAYAIEALVDLLAIDLIGADLPDKERASTSHAENLKKLITNQIDRLARYESVDGGWGYYDFRAQAQQPSSNPTSFTTATCLVALRRAQEVGVPVPGKLVERAMHCLQRQRKPDFSYLYSYHGPTRARPMRSINRPGGSLGRSQACNLALRMWDDPSITDEVIQVWLNRLFARNLWLDIGRKRPIPHESHFLVAGYFYYYGHWYAARSFAQLPSEDRPRHQAQMARLMVDLQESDGTWWDYPLYDYHQPYGTSMAIMTLMHCRTK